MDKVIYKYQVKAHGSVELPKGAHILHAATQHGQPHLWALVDPEAEIETRMFLIAPTGTKLDPAGLTYIGTFHGVEGWMVFHLFEAKEVSA